ncbi:hypothetical protein U0070_004291 [Myodes glareolus]|uniref:Uncharacterized protein n=1 Tax=Myodes glareolus TaxID=447135 RepID=A0AAW0HT88_MYOGA
MCGGGAAPAPRRGTSRGTPPPGRTPGGQSRGAPDTAPPSPRGSSLHGGGDSTLCQHPTQHTQACAPGPGGVPSPVIQDVDVCASRRPSTLKRIPGHYDVPQNEPGRTALQRRAFKAASNPTPWARGSHRSPPIPSLFHRRCTASARAGKKKKIEVRRHQVLSLPSHLAYPLRVLGLGDVR